MHKQLIPGSTIRQLSYYKTGSGPVLMLAHGFPADVQVWRELLPQLSRQYTLLLPEFLESEDTWLQGSATSMSLLASGFKDILDHEQVDRVVYCGHSMGGYMGLAFARQYPERLAGLSLLHASPKGDTEERRTARQKTIRLLEQGGKVPFLKKMVRGLFTDAFATAHPELIEQETQRALQVPDTKLIAFYRAIMERDATEEVVSGSGCPVQYLLGEDDPIANIHKDLGTDTLANINFVRVYAACAHMAMLEQPIALCTDLTEFADYCFQRS